VRLSWADSSSNETGFEIFRATGLAAATRIGGVGANVTAYADATVVANTTYTYSVRAINAAGSSAASNTVMITTPRTGIDGGAPGWTSQDIGTATVGSTTVSGSTVTLRGSGRDIWDVPDGFRFYYQREMESDCDIVARVTGITNTNGWAKAGVMFRRSLEPDSAFCMLALTPEHGVALQVRANQPSGPTTIAGPAVTAPYWLKLSRRGINYFAYWSSDGVNWTAISNAFGSSQNSSSEPLYVGLAVTSHNDGTLCTATFDNVTLTKGLPTGNAPGNLAATALSSSEIRLTWTDNSPDETQFEIERWSPDAFTRIATVGANQTTFTDTGLVAARFYDYRVRAVSANGASPYSNTAPARTEGTATPPAAPSSLAANVVSSTEVRLTWSDNSDNEYWFQLQRATGTGSFESVASIPGNTTSYLDTARTPGTTYHYKISASSGGGVSAFSNIATVTIPGDTATVWMNSDVGLVGAPGGSTQTGDTITVRGSGEDIWGPQDSFHFYNRALTGDGEISVRVTSLDNTEGWAKAGVMLRAHTGADSPYVFIYVNPSFSIAWQHRAAARTTPTFDGIYRWPPVWLKIMRTGRVFVVYYSDNGTNWTLADLFESYNMPTTLRAGLAVTSHRQGTIANATFEQLVVRETGSTQPPQPTAPSAPSNLVATVLSASEIRLTWTDNATNETGFEIMRVTDGGNRVVVGTVGVNGVFFSDTTVQPNHDYSYNVRAVNSAGASALSNTATVSTHAQAALWNSANIGNFGIAGSHTTQPTAVAVRGAGQDIWDRADGFYYVYQVSSGDVQITARVDGMENSHTWGKAGLMIRDTISSGARNAFVYMTHEVGAFSQARVLQGATTSLAEGPWWVSTPYWLRLTRRGNTFTAYTSADGTTWTFLSTQTIELPSDVLIGLAVTSHDMTKVNNAAFSNVQIGTPTN
jgi:regulation of enolase protein 1 (concanavalin A-like superfamily)